MLIVIVTALCLARHLLPEEAAVLAGIETDAAVLAMSVFAFVTLRVRLETRRAGQRSSEGKSCWVIRDDS